MPALSYLTSHKGSQSDLKRCIFSVFVDTCRSGISDYEHLIYLDGDSPNICIDSFRHIPNVFFYSSAINEGKAACINKLIMASSSEYLFFLDSDDWNLVGRTSTQLHCLKNNQHTIVGSNYLSWQPMYSLFRESHYPLHDLDIKLNFWRFPFLLYSSICLRRSDLIENNLFFDESLRGGIDYEFYSRAFQFLKVLNCKQHLVCYKVASKGGITSSPDTRSQQLSVHKKVMASLFALSESHDSALIEYLFNRIISPGSKYDTSLIQPSLKNFINSSFNRSSRNYFKHFVPDSAIEANLHSSFHQVS